jgi:hypothetical protein
VCAAHPAGGPPQGHQYRAKSRVSSFVTSIANLAARDCLDRDLPAVDGHDLLD